MSKPLEDYRAGIKQQTIMEVLNLLRKRLKKSKKYAGNKALLKELMKEIYNLNFKN
jgi:hypothetical protein